MVTGTRPLVAGLPLRTALVYLAGFVAASAIYSHLWRNAPMQDGDSPQYLEIAQDLSDLSLDTLHDRTPGYPLLLVLTGSAEQPARKLFCISLVLQRSGVQRLKGLGDREKQRRENRP